VLRPLATAVLAFFPIVAAMLAAIGLRTAADDLAIAVDCGTEVESGFVPIVSVRG
jgi:hypothetical protein